MSMIGGWAKRDQVTSPEADREESEGEVAAHCHMVPENAGIRERDISCLRDSTTFNYVQLCIQAASSIQLIWVACFSQRMHITWGQDDEPSLALVVVRAARRKLSRISQKCPAPF